MQRERDGQQELPLVPRAWEDRAAKDRMPFPPTPNSYRVTFSESKEPRAKEGQPRALSPQLPCYGAQSCVHTVDRKSSHLIHTGDFPAAATWESRWEAGPPAQGCSAVAVCEEGSTAASPICSALGDVPRWGQGSQPSWRSDNYCWVLFTNQIQCEKKNTRKYYCSPELFLRVYDTRLSTITVYIPQACGQIHPHTLTLPLTLAHSSFLMLHTWENRPGRCCPLGPSHPQRWDLRRQSRGSLQCHVIPEMCPELGPGRQQNSSGPLGSFIHSWEGPGTGSTAGCPQEIPGLRLESL